MAQAAARAAQAAAKAAVFWSKTTCDCGRWNEIHHVGIYIGDNRVIEASSSKGRVVLRDLWGENGNTWQIVLYARPHI